MARRGTCAFANGLVAERIVAVSRRIGACPGPRQSERLAHHNASAQVLAGDEPSSCRVRWCVDLLPDAMAPAIGPWCWPAFAGDAANAGRR